MISEGYTINAFQVYDYPNNAASMQMKYKNIEYHLVYNYAQDEFYEVSSNINSVLYCKISFF